MHSFEAVKPQEMKQTALQLKSLLDDYHNSMRSISEAQLERRPAPGKWSKKEILGHLVDSAQNNIRRFIVARYEETPQIVYNQDLWVKYANHQAFSFSDLLQLWLLLNRQLCHILGSADSDDAKRLCKTEEVHSLEWLAEDYITHLRHHVHQILDRKPIAYP